MPALKKSVDAKRAVSGPVASETVWQSKHQRKSHWSDLWLQIALELSPTEMTTSLRAYVRVGTCACVRVRACVCACARVRACARARVRVRSCAGVRAGVRVRLRACARARVRACACVRVCIIFLVGESFFFVLPLWGRHRVMGGHGGCDPCVVNKLRRMYNVYHMS